MNEGQLAEKIWNITKQFYNQADRPFALGDALRQVAQRFDEEDTEIVEQLIREQGGMTQQFESPM